MVTYPVTLKRFRRFFTEGIALAAAVNPHFTPSHFNETLVSPKVKHRSRMAWWVAERALASVGFPSHAVPLFFDAPGGSPTETSFANLLAVVDGTVVTPPRHLILDGISLRVTEELCGQLGIPFRESRIEPFAPPHVSEAMLVGSGFGIAAVRSFQASPESPPTVFAWPGPIFQRLLAGWSELTGTGIECEFSETAVN
ncbi:MAG: aminotransferase class IV [Gemmataceae bacterium]